MSLRPALRALLLLAAAASRSPAIAESPLWRSPTGGAEVPDQAQTESNSSGLMQNGLPVGQSFVPTTSVLERLDLRMFNAHDRRPFEIRLWEWVDTDGDGVTDDEEYAATVARAPLWTDRMALAGAPDVRTVAFFPRVAVRPGVPHYFELANGTGDGEWTVSKSQTPGPDPYVRGRARLNGRFQSIPQTALDIDLWFKTYGPPAGPAPPPICEDTGEPAPCFSAPGPWTEAEPPGPPPTRDDYLSIVERFADNGRASILAADGSNAGAYAFFDAFLYRATGDETHAAWAAELLEHQLAWREANPTAPYVLFWAESSGWAYRWIAASPTLTAQQHAKFRRLLVLHAKGLSAELETGLQNHALACALTMKLVTDLVPAEEFAALTDGAATAEDHAAWRAFADSVWSEYKQWLDVWEDASQYHFFELRHILELSELYGDDAFLWSSPGFRAFLDRVFAAHTTLGPYPLFGDTQGWNVAWGTTVWVFERAGRELRDPKYRWLAQRVFDYQRSHLLPTRVDGTPIELWQAVYSEYPAFAFAYFAYDPTAPVAAPRPLRRKIAARQALGFDTAWPAGPTRIGQTFVASAAPLERISLLVKVAQPVTAEIRLWPWLGTPGGSVLGTPLFAQSLVLPGRDVWITLEIEMHADVDIGSTYFLELRGDGPFEVAGRAPGTVDPYLDGVLWVGDVPRTDADLWFRTWSLSGLGSVVTDRLEAVSRRVSQWGVPQRKLDFTGARVPERLVLRSGIEPDDLQVVVSLIGGDYFHGQEETGAVLSLTDGGSRVLADGAYFERFDAHHAVPMVRRYTGAGREAVEPVRVTHFRDGVGATVAHVTWQDRNGWPVDLERRFLMVKNRFLLVRDRARFAGTMEASVGAQWTGYDLRADHGPNWFEIYDREPRAINGVRFRNPERYALLWMVPRTGTEIDSWREVRTGNPTSPPYIVAQRFTGDAAPGDERWFDSLVIPHDATVAPADLAAAVSVVYDDGTAVALRVSIGDETWTIVDNPRRISIATSSLSTDAAYAITRTRDHDRIYAYVQDATRLHVDGGAGQVIDLGWLAPSSAEIGAGRLAARLGHRPGETVVPSAALRSRMTRDPK